MVVVVTFDDSVHDETTTVPFRQDEVQMMRACKVDPKNVCFDERDCIVTASDRLIDLFY